MVFNRIGAWTIDSIYGEYKYIHITQAYIQGVQQTISITIRFTFVNYFHLHGWKSGTEPSQRFQKGKLEKKTLFKYPVHIFKLC